MRLSAAKCRCIPGPVFLESAPRAADTVGEPSATSAVVPRRGEARVAWLRRRSPAA
jgi:hypothetical protein